MRFCDLTHAGEYCTTRLSASGRADRRLSRDSTRPGDPPGRSAAKRSASAPSVSRTCRTSVTRFQVNAKRVFSFGISGFS